MRRAPLPLLLVALAAARCGGSDDGAADTDAAAGTDGAAGASGGAGGAGADVRGAAGVVGDGSAGSVDDAAAGASVDGAAGAAAGVTGGNTVPMGVAGSSCPTAGAGGAPSGPLFDAGVDDFTADRFPASEDASSFDGGFAGHDDSDALVDGGPASLPDGRCVANAFPRDGICTCEVGLPNICADACTDLTVDDANCGACGHACGPTSTCNAGQCGPAVANVVPASPGCGALDITVVGSTLYYTDAGHGTVNSVPTAGGATTVIASAESTPGLIAVSGSTVFWVDTALLGCNAPTMTAAIRKATFPGGALTTLVTETNDTGGIRGLTLSVDGTTVYYSAGTKVRMVPAAGGAAADVGVEPSGGIPTALALDGDQIATPTDLNGDVDVMTVAPGTVASCGMANQFGDLVNVVNCSRLARSQGGLLLTAILYRNSRVIWANDGNIVYNDATPDAGQDNQEITTTPFGGPITALIATPTSFYFSEDDTGDGSGARIEKTAVQANSTAVRLVRGQSRPVSMAVDSARVYWSTSACDVNATGL
jgi:hypothetical protein